MLLEDAVAVGRRKEEGWESFRSVVVVVVVVAVVPSEWSGEEWEWGSDQSG